MDRLTDRVRAQKIKENADKLRAAGVAVSPDHELYIRLAEYENAEEDGRLNEYQKLLIHYQNLSNIHDSTMVSIADIGTVICDVEKGKLSKEEALKQIDDIAIGTILLNGMVNTGTMWKKDESGGDNS